MERVLLEKIAGLEKVPLCVYQEGKELFHISEQEDFESIFSMEPSYLEQLEATAYSQAVPFLFYDTTEVLYGSLFAGDWLIVCGPVTPVLVTENLQQRFQERHQLRNLPFIRYLSMSRMGRILSLIAYALTEMDISPREIQILSVDENVKNWDAAGDMEHYELEQSDEERDHNSRDYEEMLLRIVREGDTSAMEHLIRGSEQLEHEHIGVLAHTRVKQVEYMSVTLITLLSRAAVTGGASMEKAYSLADVYMQKLSICRGPDEMGFLSNRAAYDFTKLVNESRNSDTKNRYVEDCKAYIDQNLRKPFKVGDIAEAIGVNRSYLTRKFTEMEGVTIQQYITRERCRHAANLLRHSDYSIAEISMFYCFSSQSHFGHAFKECMGMTPKDYRNQNRVETHF